MKNQELFHKTVGILVNAYLKGTLLHNNCAACAVGNIIAKSNGFANDSLNGKVFWVKGNQIVSPAFWRKVFITTYTIEKKPRTFFEWLSCKPIETCRKRTNHFNPKSADEEFLSLIRPTGYTIFNLARIEFAFENVDTGNCEDEYMINGLMAVVDVLQDIHEATHEETEQAKSLFKKELAELG